MAELLQEMPLSAGVKAALLGRRGPATAPLELVKRWERGHWKEVAAWARALGVQDLDLMEIYTRASEQAELLGSV